MAYRCQRCDAHCNHRAIKVVVETRADGSINTELSVCPSCSGYVGSLSSLAPRPRKVQLGVRGPHGVLASPGMFVVADATQVLSA
jgi:hypothetical protein